MGFEGLLVPSATGGGINLVVYPLNLGLDSSIEERPPMIWANKADLPDN
jgi:hypothetical protein